MPMKKLALEQASDFFYEHAGYCYNPATETPEEGRRRCSWDLATAEQEAQDRGWWVRWAADIHDDGFPIPETCEYATLLDEDGEILASIGCVDDADDDYRRVVAAELACEVLP